MTACTPAPIDTFQMKIWSEEGGGESVVYENDKDQALGGGSIVIYISTK